MRLITIFLSLFFLLPTLIAQPLERSFTIPKKTRLCPRDTKRGDREFSGNGPKVTGTARLVKVGKTRLKLELSLYVVETKSDWTEAKRDWTYSNVYTAPSGYYIKSVESNKSYSRGFYIDKDHSLDKLTQTGGTESGYKITGGKLVKQFDFKGDTGGKDIGNCTTDDVYMNVHFNSVKVTIQRPETLIQSLSTRTSFPVNRANKMSQDLNGLAHDSQNWFFTQSGSLWKVPVSFNLASIDKLQPEGSKMVEIPPLLQRRGYNRFGDLDYYAGYLFVALEGEGRVEEKPMIAVFSANNLELIETIALDTWQTTIGWCAIDPSKGYLYSSVANSSFLIKKYKVNVQGNKVSLGSPSDYKIYTSTGSRLNLRDLKGGSFSSNGRYLFLVNGNADPNTATRRVWSFNVRSRRAMRVASYGSGVEPKSITYWNIGSKAPGVSGHLHMITLKQPPESRDEFSFRHYSVTEYTGWYEAMPTN